MHFSGISMDSIKCLAAIIWVDCIYVMGNNVDKTTRVRFHTVFICCCCCCWCCCCWCCCCCCRRCRLCRRQPRVVQFCFTIWFFALLCSLMPLCRAFFVDLPFSWSLVLVYQRYFILLCVNLVMWRGNQLRMNLSFFFYPPESMRLVRQLRFFSSSLLSFATVIVAQIYTNCVFALNVCFDSWFNSFYYSIRPSDAHRIFRSLLFSHFY